MHSVISYYRVFYNECHKLEAIMLGILIELSDKMSENESKYKINGIFKNLYFLYSTYSVLDTTE